LGALLFGITLGWSAPAGPKIISSENEFMMTEDEFSWAVSMMPLGGAFSCVISGVIRNRFGTRFTIFVFALPNLVGWILLAYGWNALMVCN
jgi:MFS family permease